MKRVIYFLDLSQQHQNLFDHWEELHQTQVHYHSSISSILESIKLHQPIALIIYNCFNLSSIKDQLSSIDLPIIVLCDEDSSYARLAAASINSYAYLTIPIDYNNLLSVLDSLYLKKSCQGNILLVSSNWDRIRLHRQALSTNNLLVFSVMTAGAALEHILYNECDLIICDYKIEGDYSAIDLCIAVRNNDQFHKIPIILLADSLTQDDRARVISIESLYVLPRYVNYRTLAQSVKSSISLWYKQQHTIITDSTTGLYTRVPTLRLLEVLINHLAWEPQPLSAVLISLERKQQKINNYEISQFIVELRKIVGPKCYLSSLSKYEFVVIMPSFNYNNAIETMDRFKNLSNTLIANCYIGVVEYCCNQTSHDLIVALQEQISHARISNRRVSY